MTRPALRIGNVASGAVLVGGAIAIALPQHVVSIAQLVAGAVAAAAGLRVLAVHVPPTGWMHPLKWASPFGDAGPAARKPAAGDELDRIRTALSRPRQRIAGAPALPPETLRLVTPLLRSALELDREGPVDRSRLPETLSPTARAILLTDPRPHASRIFLARADERGVSETVLEVLDELERLTGDAPRTGSSVHSASSPPHSSPRTGPSA